MNQPIATLSNRLQRGFTMLELLIALVILSVGLLSLAGLQATGLRNNHSAYLRSQATVLAYNALDRMRANLAPALAGNYNIGLGVTTIPTSQPQALTDLTEWVGALSNTLPSGQGRINVAANIVTIQVQWDDSRGAGNVTSFTLNTRL